MSQRPFSASEALARMVSMIGMDYPYELGTGNYHPGTPTGPWDCAGAAQCEAYGLTRHRPGFAAGPLPKGWERFADVEEHINTNSAIKDAITKQDLYRMVPDGAPLEPGDLLMYPTIIIKDADDGEIHKFIGHVQMVRLPRGAVAGGPYRGVVVLHCHGPNGRRPAVTEDFALVMDKHNEVWPKPIHKAHALRVVP